MDVIGASTLNPKADKSNSDSVGDRAPLLSMRGLTVDFATDFGTLTAVEDVDLEIYPGEVVGIVGESGSGKSVTVMSILGLLPGSANVRSGRVELDGKNLTGLSARAMRKIKGREIGVIFQDPMSSLNPVMTLGWQLREAIETHQPKLDRRQVHDKCVELFSAVGIPDPAARLKQYPHEFSGGMRQRAMIAIALANDPVLLIADEPTTALDVTVQAQVMRVLTNPEVRGDAALILVTHDLGLVAQRAHRVIVMYGGRVVESGDVQSIFKRPRHPYTVALLKSLPRIGTTNQQLATIPGTPPSLFNRPEGCSFQPRCWLGADRPECGVVPDLVEVGDQHVSACHFVDEVAAAGSDGVAP